jgi:transposase
LRWERPRAPSCCGKSIASSHPDGYCYSRFCHLYRRWKKRQDVVLRQEHRAGEKLFLDWAGATIPIHHRDGSVHQAPLFVAALGVSSYTYAEATPDQQMASWLKVQVNALEFYGGCPQLLIPDIWPPFRSTRLSLELV